MAVVLLFLEALNSNSVILAFWQNIHSDGNRLKMVWSARYCIWTALCFTFKVGFKNAKFLELGLYCASQSLSPILSCYWLAQFKMIENLPKGWSSAVCTQPFFFWGQMVHSSHYLNKISSFCRVRLAHRLAQRNSKSKQERKFWIYVETKLWQPIKT